MASSPDNNTTTSNSTAAGGIYFYDEGTARFNPTNAAVIISLVGGCLVLAFVAVILRKYLRRATGVTTLQSNIAQPNATQSGSDVVKPKGLQKVDLDALPLVHREDFDEADAPHDCPVCLSNFEPEDSLRLLPTCKHVFHRECIDAWFDAHSTCPLCRASLVAESAGEGKSSNSGREPVAVLGGHGEPVETITEVSESGDSSDIESRPQHTSNAAPIHDSRTSTLISREDSVPGALVRNFESFKHVTIDSDQQPSTKNANFRKPPTSPSIRRSSSLSADLIALRNLLKRQSDQNVDGPTRRWFSRARSLDTAPGDRSDGDNWVTIDLETGTAALNADAQQAPSSSHSSEVKLPKGPPERSWSDRWSLASMKDAMVSPLTRSSSHGSSPSAHLPI